MAEFHVLLLVSHLTILADNYNCIHNCEPVRFCGIPWDNVSMYETMLEYGDMVLVLLVELLSVNEPLNVCKKV